MPTAQPTQVIVHRIELQKTERQYLEKYLEDSNKLRIASTASSALIPVIQVGAVVGLGWITLKVWAEIQEALNGPLAELPNAMVKAVASVNPFQEPFKEEIERKIGKNPAKNIQNYDIDTEEGRQRYLDDVRKYEKHRRDILNLLNPSNWF